MPRQLRTIDEIKAEIQHRIETNAELDGDCRECRAPGINIVREPERNGGCNWSPSFYRGPAACRGFMEHIVADVQALYNVHE